MLYRVHLAWWGFELTTLVVIDTDCIGSHKSNYHNDHDQDDPSTNDTCITDKILVILNHDSPRQVVNISIIM